MTVWDPDDRGAMRGGTAMERYVRELRRDAERMRRASRPHSRSDSMGAEDRSPVNLPFRPSPESATDDRPAVA
jgi:hypothetical protein